MQQKGARPSEPVCIASMQTDTLAERRASGAAASAEPGAPAGAAAAGEGAERDGAAAAGAADAAACTADSAAFSLLLPTLPAPGSGRLAGSIAPQPRTEMLVCVGARVATLPGVTEGAPPAACGLGGPAVVFPPEAVLAEALAEGLAALAAIAAVETGTVVATAEAAVVAEEAATGAAAEGEARAAERMGQEGGAPAAVLPVVAGTPLPWARVGASVPAACAVAATVEL